ncbi:amino acid/amide ABC transporter membrane protein 2, HAAT family (TC 3.A.1.4.-) [Sporobacter termitidis DSM 10068]|uniref:Amino acid/amide ABC transporter membrane protein 2, HAAT family (TC 3.A.1.4.-) n=1 Tax=Sporobacter termitidis DSM 10068 TaxID=1123282 RepID=A0A1M5Z777_9FIRM|nr:branched-chain amino acid ABC transporter permease [Sporobacter termitidis]SHI19743.1 amino acid/amide ABC transporter membrane protein 2, HAAT family (TC 3.A.1.4.-) [Sporobacter termitidis DSM 10068]
MIKGYKGIPMPVRYLINAGLFVVFLVVVSSLTDAKVISTYNNKIIMLIGINIILAVSLNLATGYLGQLPLGHAGFMAVGAYASAIFMKAVIKTLPLGLSLPLGLLIGGLVAAVFGFIIGIPALRLKGDYLAIITLGFGEIIRVILLNIDSVIGFKLTYGAAGLKSIPKTTTFLDTFICVFLVCFVIHAILKSRHGRAVLSIRENEIAAESCGINTTYYKTMAFVMSAFFAGVAGSLYAGYIGILDPTGFGFMKSIEILVMVVLGGMGSMIGSVISATVLTALPEFLREFDAYRMVVYSLLLVVVMIFKPTGLMGTYDFSLSRLLGKPWERLTSGGKSKKAGDR